MRQLTVGERFKTYFDTLNRCGVFLLNSSDRDIEYNIFEEFDIGVVSFLHDNNLSLFEEEGIIDEDIFLRSQDLRKHVMSLQNTELWNVKSVKNSKEWLAIMKMSDEIRSLIKNKWSDNICPQQ